jgi:hypothetical protein
VIIDQQVVVLTTDEIIPFGDLPSFADLDASLGLAAVLDVHRFLHGSWSLDPARRIDRRGAGWGLLPFPSWCVGWRKKPSQVSLARSLIPLS